MLNFNKLIVSSVLAWGVLASGCGGSSDTATTSAPDTLSGVAAAGAPLIGQVTVKGALGNTKSAYIEADGSYEVDVTGLTAPYRLRAEGSVGGKTYKLHSYAESADIGGTVNITPFTDLIIANAAQQLAENFFDSTSTVELDSTEVEAQEEALQAKLQDVFDALGVGSAIDLLNTSFSADHSGLDAALDIVRIEQTSANIVTITNLIENTTISDDILDTSDNSDVLDVSDASALTGAVSDTQAIVAVFDALSAAFANGLPTQSAIQDYFADDFYDSDEPKGVLLTDIITDPNMVGWAINNVVVSDLDSVAGTAKVTINDSINGVVFPDPFIWFMAKDSTLGWQIRGDQRIVETDFSFHCNDNDGSDNQPGGCGVNTRFWDSDFTNNGTANDAPIASGTVSIYASDGVTLKDVIYLGTPTGTSAGDVQVYDESAANYSGDWRGFGSTLGTIDSSIFAADDIIQYDLYTEALDLTTGGTSAPQIASGAVPVATYTDTLLFAPSTSGSYPTATAATLTAMSGFELGDTLTVAWTLADATRNSEVLVEVSDSMGNRMETWIETFGSTATSTTFASSALDSTAASAAGLDANAETYQLLVRIYAEDVLTGQAHSTDYSTSIPGPAAPNTGGSTGSLTCSTESGFDDTADGGLGAPTNPHSFADFETVVVDCGSASVIDYTAIAGKTFNDGGELSIFDSASSAPTAGSPGTGRWNDGGELIEFSWYLENAVGYDYLVIEGTYMSVSFRDTYAITSISGTPGTTGVAYTSKVYTEQSNYSTDSMTRGTGSDGEIWSTTLTQQ